VHRTTCLEQKKNFNLSFTKDMEMKRRVVSKLIYLFLVYKIILKCTDDFSFSFDIFLDLLITLSNIPKSITNGPGNNIMILISIELFSWF
jgi:hypothetical protein